MLVSPVKGSAFVGSLIVAMPLVLLFSFTCSFSLISTFVGYSIANAGYKGCSCRISLCVGHSIANAGYKGCYAPAPLFNRNCSFILIFALRVGRTRTLVPYPCETRHLRIGESHFVLFPLLKNPTPLTLLLLKHKATHVNGEIRVCG